MSSTPIHLHNGLKTSRRLRRHSQQDLAWLLDIKSASRISDWENGISFPSLKNLLKLSIIYSTLVDQMFSEYRNQLRDELFEREKQLQEMKKSGKKPFIT